MQEVMQAFHQLDELDPWMNRLRNFFMRSILLPLINNEASVNVEDGELYSYVQVAVKMKSRKPNYSSTLDNLTKVFKSYKAASCGIRHQFVFSHFVFLNSFQCFEFLHGEVDVRFDNGDSFIGLLGSGISEEFTDNLIKQCLKETVPSLNSELVNVSGIRERVSAFNTYMVGIGKFSCRNIFPIF